MLLGLEHSERFSQGENTFSTTELGKVSIFWARLSQIARLVSIHYVQAEVGLRGIL